MRARVRIWLIIASTLVLGAEDCPQRPAEPDVLPTIASIEILPGALTIPAGSSVTLVAQLKDEWGTVLTDPRVNSVMWRTTTGPAVTPGPSNSVVVTTTASTTGVVLVAAIGDVSTTATLTVQQPPPTVSGSGTENQVLTGGSPSSPAVDWIRAPASGSTTNPGLPTIALVDGVASGVNQNDEAFAFVGSLSVGSFTCAGSMCGEITLFPPERGVRRDTANWTANCDFVDFATGQPLPTTCQPPTTSSALTPLPQRVHIPVVIWQASNYPDADALIAGDTAYVDSVFSQAWMGVDLDVTVNIAAAATETLRYYSSCTDPEFDMTNQLLGIADAEFKPDRITVVYVDKIVSAHAQWNEISAFACPFDPVEGTLILMSHDGAGASTLAHELGHALGGWDFHTDALSGFDNSNLMLSAESPQSRTLRKHLNLGQLFQVSFSKGAFIKASGTTTGPGLTCSTDPTLEVPCPRLAKDLIP